MDKWFGLFSKGIKNDTPLFTLINNSIHEYTDDYFNQINLLLKNLNLPPLTEKATSTKSTYLDNFSRFIKNLYVIDLKKSPRLIQDAIEYMNINNKDTILPDESILLHNFFNTNIPHSDETLSTFLNRIDPFNVSNAEAPRIHYLLQLYTKQIYQFFFERFFNPSESRHYGSFKYS